MNACMFVLLHWAGGGTLEIWGVNFFSVSVKIGDADCPIIGTYNDTFVSCVIPAGVGFNLHVSVESEANFVSAVRTNAFSYEKPFINAVRR